jgi:hypothetical protein
MVVAGTPAASGALSSGAPACGTAGLRLSVSDQGTSGSAFIGIRAQARSRCAIVGSARLTILQAGRKASVAGNPITLRLNGLLVPHTTRLVAHAWWIGWCKSRKALSVRVEYRTLSVRTAAQYVPRCDSPTARSRLVAVR